MPETLIFGSAKDGEVTLIPMAGGEPPTLQLLSVGDYVVAKKLYEKFAKGLPSGMTVPHYTDVVRAYEIKRSCLTVPKAGYEFCQMLLSANGYALFMAWAHRQNP